VIFNTQIGDEHIYTLREYTPELEQVSEKTFPAGVMPLTARIYNNDDKIYCGYNTTVHVLDLDLNIIKEYSVSKEETGAFLSFVQAADGTMFLLRHEFSDPNEDFEALSYTITDIESGNETLIDLPANSYLSLFTTLYPGDSTYDFYSELSSTNTIAVQFFADNIIGNYWCGINRDGSITKILLLEDFEESRYFREGVTIDGKRYYIDYETVDQAREYYLYECSAVYED
jgi:hypothetical protein